MFQYHLYLSGNINFHIIRADEQELSSFIQGARFQNGILQDTDGIVVTAFRNADGNYTFTSEISINMTNSELDNLEWEIRTWG